MYEGTLSILWVVYTIGTSDFQSSSGVISLLICFIVRTKNSMGPNKASRSGSTLLSKEG